jgi:hypothetical protein
VVAILADENIRESVVAGLRDRDVDVVPAQELGLGGASDEVLMERARDGERLLLTNDNDLLGLADERDHRGLVFQATQYAEPSDVPRSVVGSSRRYRRTPSMARSSTSHDRSP